MNEKTKGKRKNKTGIIIISVFLLFLILIIIFIRNASPIIIAISEANVNAMVTASVNNAISGTISDSIKYENLVKETKDENGNTKTLSANIPAINELGNNIVCLSEKLIKNAGVQKIEIPFGTLLSTPIFVGKGPIYHINVYPYTSVICRFISEFNEAGINQVRHKIYLDIITHVDLVMPTAKSNFNVHIQILIAENILTGDVPYTYLFVDGNGSNLLDLIP